MHTESTESRAVNGPRLERAIVLQLLRDDRERGWSSPELGIEMDAEAPTLEEALRRLEGEGVLCLAQDAVQASRATRRLDELGLLSV
jgi:hypothetical protein